MKKQPSTTGTNTDHWSVAGHAHLQKADPVLASLFGEKPLEFSVAEGLPDIHMALLRSVTGQQLSVKAAATIWNRFRARFSENGILSPETIIQTPDETFREIGLSRQKTGYVKAIAAFAQDGHLEVASILIMTPEELTAHLTQIKGVGRWTAEMVQMFALDLPDVFSPGDLGIQNAMRKAYGLTETGKSFLQRIEAIAENWKPYRTLACRYLWKSLE